MSHILLLISLSNFFHIMRGNDFRDRVEEALHCYKSVTDTSFQVAFDFNLIFPSPPLLLIMELEYYLLDSALDTLPLLVKQKFTLKLIDTSCDNTIEIYDNNSPDKYILLKISVFTASSNPQLLSYKFIINPQCNSKIMAIRDYHNIAEIYIDFKRQHPGTLKLPTDKYFDISNFHNKCMCVAKDNKKFLLRPMMDGKLYEFKQPYNIIIFDSDTMKHNSLSEFSSVATPCWPCECTNTKLLYGITIIIPDSPTDIRVNINIKFANGRYLQITPPIDNSQLSVTPKNQLYFENVKIERISQSALRTNDKTAIYLFKTLKEMKLCPNSKQINIMKFRSTVLDFQVTQSETIDDTSLTRWYTYMDSPTNNC